MADSRVFAATDALLRALAEAGLPHPDVLELGDDDVAALYHEQKLAVFIELRDPFEDAIASRSPARDED